MTRREYRFTLATSKISCLNNPPFWRCCSARAASWCRLDAYHADFPLSMERFPCVVLAGVTIDHVDPGWATLVFRKTSTQLQGACSLTSRLPLMKKHGYVREERSSVTVSSLPWVGQKKTIGLLAGALNCSRLRVSVANCCLVWNTAV